MRRTGLAVAFLAVWASAARLAAQNATLEITESALNKLLAGIGRPSAAGSYQPVTYSNRLSEFGLKFEKCEVFGFLDCPIDAGRGRKQLPLVFCRTPFGGVRLMPSGDPITWEWTIRDAKYTIANGSMSVTATVRMRAATTTTDVTATVPASVSFSSSTHRLRVQPGAWSVPLDYNGATITTIDVADRLTLALPLEQQTVSVPLPNGATRTINARVVSATTQYQTGRLTLTFDLGF
jgi:hypothetical protein